VTSQSSETADLVIEEFSSDDEDELSIDVDDEEENLEEILARENKSQTELEIHSEEIIQPSKTETPPKFSSGVDQPLDTNLRETSQSLEKETSDSVTEETNCEDEAETAVDVDANIENVTEIPIDENKKGPELEKPFEENENDSQTPASVGQGSDTDSKETNQACDEENFDLVIEESSPEEEAELIVDVDEDTEKSDKILQSQTTEQTELESQDGKANCHNENEEETISAEDDQQSDSNLTENNQFPDSEMEDTETSRLEQGAGEIEETIPETISLEDSGVLPEQAGEAKVAARTDSQEMVETETEAADETGSWNQQVETEDDLVSML
jgi:hypothetical protein